MDLTKGIKAKDVRPEEEHGTRNHNKKCRKRNYTGRH